MQADDDIRELIERLHVPASAELDERVQDTLRHAERREPLASASSEPSLLALLVLIMKKKSVRYTLGTTLGLVLIVGLFLNHSTTTAWAMEQAIEALQKYTAVRMTGYTTAGGGPAPTEIWARANATGTRSDECLVRSDKFTAWVEDNKTYVYDHASNKVLVEPAITMGMDPWLGPKLLAQLAKMPDYKAVEGNDPATGQKQIIVTASIESATGPQSFTIEFDASTKLPVSMEHWSNVDRAGSPDFAFDKILYFEDLPDQSFSFEPPAEVLFEAKPLTIPEANLGMLSDPKSGIAVDGLSRDAACRKVLEQFWDAVIKDDLETIRHLCPLTTAWPDPLLLDVIAEDRVVELLQIGDIEQEGQSRLGRLALVPSRVRCQDGRVREIKIVIQFRQSDQEPSCVIHGNYGYSVVVE
jgi:hypothetical protein